jgi:hypothetical protein
LTNQQKLEMVFVPDEAAGEIGVVEAAEEVGAAVNTSEIFLFCF